MYLLYYCLYFLHYIWLFCLFVGVLLSFKMLLFKLNCFLDMWIVCEQNIIAWNHIGSCIQYSLMMIIDVN